MTLRNKNCFTGNRVTTESTCTGQAPVRPELSCQGPHSHQALAAHHLHPHSPQLAPGQVLHQIQNPTPHSQVSLAPQYLSDLLHLHTISRTLRSTDICYP